MSVSAVSVPVYQVTYGRSVSSHLEESNPWSELATIDQTDEAALCSRMRDWQ